MHTAIENKWRVKWDEEKLYVANINKAKSTFYGTETHKFSKKPFYNLWMFPYPSAEGLHAGHAFASTGSDIYGRFMRMNGREVFQPIGYDSFGIHSENYAIKIGETPQKMLERTTSNYEKQLRSLGHGYDWTRTVTTSDKDYYSGTQWLFLEMFKSGLAYKKKASVNFCPSCKTVLADEQVMSPTSAGKEPKDSSGTVVSDRSTWDDLKVCERCATVVEKRELMQWFFRITDYAERLLEGLEKIEWSPRVTISQKEWIGKKSGINITYKVSGHDATLTVFTTAPVNYGASFIVVSPEYARENLIKFIHKDQLDDIEKYIKSSLAKTDQIRKSQEKDKTGVFTGLYAKNHLTSIEIPIWVADFVLADVGTGAVQGCPGHDKRDFQFAKKFGISIPRVVIGEDGYDGPIDNIDQVVEHGKAGKFVNSGFLNGLDFEDGLIQTMDYFESKGWGQRVIKYHLRDWLVSRQRYWGAPIPMIYCQSCADKSQGYFNTIGNVQGESLHILHKDQSDWNSAGWWPESTLPVELPEMTNYQPEGTGHGPLSHIPEFYEVKCPSCGSKATRETDVMDTFVDSSWYFLKYPSVGLNPKSKIQNQDSNLEIPWSPEITKNWLPVDLYFGGAEHSVLHLMYARFVNMVMHDKGYIDHEEPFPRFFAHGLMIKDGAKMSKSRGNVVNPDDYLAKFGADTMRLYLMFMGPMDGYPDFRDTGIEGMQKFVNRIWKIYKDYKDIILVEESAIKSLNNKLHLTIKNVTEDIREFKYNTAIASMMKLVNYMYDILGSRDDHKKESKNKSSAWKDALANLALLIAPFAPHLAEEIWVEELGNDFSVHKHNWPQYDLESIKEERITITVQVNGKLRGQLSVEAEYATNEPKIREIAEANQNISKWIKDAKVKKVIFVPGKIINFVIS